MIYGVKYVFQLGCKARRTCQVDWALAPVLVPGDRNGSKTAQMSRVRVRGQRLSIFACRECT